MSMDDYMDFPNSSIARKVAPIHFVDQSPFQSKARYGVYVYALSYDMLQSMNITWQYRAG